MTPRSVEVMRPGRPRPEAVGPRSLAPREHGAYGQLALPLVAALGMGRPSVSAALMTVGAVAVFLAHEPVLVVAGLRGTRAQREDGGRARRRLVLLGIATALAGGVGVWLAPPAARTAAVVPIALALVLAPLLARGEEKTAPGELLAAATLVTAAVPVAIAARVAPHIASGAAAAWWLVFAASTLVVRGVIAHARASVAWPRRLAAPVIAACAALALGADGVLSPAAAVGAVPMLALALVLAARPPSPRSLKRVGWALVAASVALAVSLVAGAHV